MTFAELKHAIELIESRNKIDDDAKVVFTAEELVKKVTIIIGIFAIAISVIAFATSMMHEDNVAYANTMCKGEESVFDIVYRDGSYKVLQDRQTDVLYLLVYYRRGYTITPLLNSDGTPRTSMRLPK